MKRKELSTVCEYKEIIRMFCVYGWQSLSKSVYVI